MHAKYQKPEIVLCTGEPTDVDYAYGGEHWVKYRIVQSPCCIPKLCNILCQLYFNEKKMW